MTKKKNGNTRGKRNCFERNEKLIKADTRKSDANLIISKVTLFRMYKKRMAEINSES